MKTYKTIESAAFAALAEAIPLAQQHRAEYGAFIVGTPETGYYYTPPVTSHDPHSLDMTETFHSLTNNAMNPMPAWVTQGMDDPISRTMATMIYNTVIATQHHIVSHVHTHGCNWTPGQSEDNAQMFSGTDLVQTVAQGFKRTYLGVACSGDVFESPDINRQTFQMGLISMMILGEASFIGRKGKWIGNISQHKTEVLAA